MSQIEDGAVWCANAYQDEVPTELEQTEHCNAVGTVLVLDPAGAWSGLYCPNCANTLVSKGWTLPQV